jgi:molecular chaperone DnaJ
MPRTNHYAVLGVRRDATKEEIRRAYRRKARELHPDVNPDPAAQERIQEVNTAYDVLSDPGKRETYDMGGDPLSASGGASGSPFAGFGGLGDVFEAFFGGGAGPGAQAGAGQRSRVRAGADALIRLDLDLDETAFGTDKDIEVDTAGVCPSCDGEGTAAGTRPETCGTCHGRGEVRSVQRTFLGQVVTARPCHTCGGTGTVIPRPCPECAGEGRVRTRRSLTVQVPAGVADGTHLRLTGEGEVGPGGGPSGDLYVEIRERPHPVFTRDGFDLHCNVTLPMTGAALGTHVVVPTLDGDEDVELRAGTQSGSTQTVRGRGVTKLRSSGRGDLHVHVTVATPTRLDAEQERLLRELATLREEDRPEVEVTSTGGGLFSRLRDAFK